MRSKSKLYTQGDKALSDRVRNRSKKRSKTDEERLRAKNKREAKLEALKKTAVAAGPGPKPTTQKYFEDYGL